jgi:hypothetical protein
MNIFALFVLLGIILAYFTHPILILFYFGKRKNLANEELLEMFDKTRCKQKEVVLKVLTVIANSYKIPMGKLRPNDLLDGPISKIDSWRLGHGAEMLSSYYEEHSQSTPSFSEKASLNDLVELLADLEKNDNHSN